MDSITITPPSREGLPTLPVFESEQPPLLTREDYDACAVKLARLRESVRQIEDAFEPAVKAAHQAHRAMTGLRAEMCRPFEHLADSCKMRMQQWDQARERERLAERQRLEAAASRLAEPAAPVPLVPAVPEPEAMGRTESWRVRSVDLALVPVEYLRPEYAIESDAQYAALLRRLNLVARRSRGSVVIPGVVFEKSYTYRSKPQ